VRRQRPRFPANLAVGHIGQYPTGTASGSAYPNQMFTGWILPASPINKSPNLTDIDGKRVRITGRIEFYKGKPEIRINKGSQLEVK
jgi:hypothetical protein